VDHSKGSEANIRDDARWKNMCQPLEVRLAEAAVVATASAAAAASAAASSFVADSLEYTMDDTGGLSDNFLPRLSEMQDQLEELVATVRSQVAARSTGNTASDGAAVCERECSKQLPVMGPSDIQARMEHISQSLCRAQSRLESLEARVARLCARVDFQSCEQSSDIGVRSQVGAEQGLCMYPDQFRAQADQQLSALLAHARAAVDEELRLMATRADAQIAAIDSRFRTLAAAVETRAAEAASRADEQWGHAAQAAELRFADADARLEVQTCAAQMPHTVPLPVALTTPTQLPMESPRPVFGPATPPGYNVRQAVAARNTAPAHTRAHSQQPVRVDTPVSVSPPRGQGPTLVTGCARYTLNQLERAHSAEQQQPSATATLGAQPQAVVAAVQPQVLAPHAVVPPVRVVDSPRIRQSPPPLQARPPADSAPTSSVHPRRPGAPKPPLLQAGAGPQALAEEETAVAAVAARASSLRRRSSRLTAPAKASPSRPVPHNSSDVCLPGDHLLGSQSSWAPTTSPPASRPSSVLCSPRPPDPASTPGPTSAVVEGDVLARSIAAAAEAAAADPDDPVGAPSVLVPRVATLVSQLAGVLRKEADLPSNVNLLMSS